MKLLRCSDNTMFIFVNGNILFLKETFVIKVCNLIEIYGNQCIIYDRNHVV